MLAPTSTSASTSPSHGSRSYQHEGLVGTPGYLAPEIISKLAYSPASDVWSIGVIMYILLSGHPPFPPSDDTEDMDTKGHTLEFPSDQWCHISDGAIALIRAMLSVCPTHRLTCCAILAHSWICTNHSTTQLPNATLVCLESFWATRKFQTAAMAIMRSVQRGRRESLSRMMQHQVSRFTAAELHHISIAFKAASDGDGNVSQASFSTVMCSLGLTQDTRGHRLPLDRMYELFDANGNNLLDYKEFLLGLGTLREDNATTLKFCFELFDTDNSKSISLSELGALYGHLAAEATPPPRSSSSSTSASCKADNILTMFKSLDTNGDGEINFEEFKHGVKTIPALTDAFVRPMRQRLSVLSPSHSKSKSTSSPVPSTFTTSPRDEKEACGFGAITSSESFSTHLPNLIPPLIIISKLEGL